MSARHMPACSEDNERKKKEILTQISMTPNQLRVLFKAKPLLTELQ